MEVTSSSGTLVQTYQNTRYHILEYQNNVLYKLQDLGVGFRIPVALRIFTSGVHRTSYPLGTGALSSWVNRSDR
jgi:hypothetical protein